MIALSYAAQAYAAQAYTTQAYALQAYVLQGSLIAGSALQQDQGNHATTSPHSDSNADPGLQTLLRLYYHAMTTHCLLVTALKAEANPLISHYSLSPVVSKAAPAIKLWRRGTMTLAVSGLGKVNAAIATATALASLPVNSVCVNVGIAGCGRPVGTLLRACKITDAATHKSWYPMDTSKGKDRVRVPGIDLVTVDLPHNEYTPDTAFEMEASGFYQAASQFSLAELILSLKVVSDNSKHPLDQLMSTGEQQKSHGDHGPIPATPVMGLQSGRKKALSKCVESLIGDNLVDIDRTIGHVIEQTSMLPTPSSTDALLQLLCQENHFTESQRLQLGNLLCRYRVLIGNPETLGLQRGAIGAVKILKKLQHHLHHRLPMYE